MNKPRDSAARNFAITVVQKLVDAGHTAVWAGGCVRDEFLGLTPKDYDIATSATPDQVIELFGRRTVPVGVSFGVVMVLGPSAACGQIEVATFRSDGQYLDGRRPDSIEFCGPEEDAQRRDFTINGMFFDPLTQQLLDYVEGQQDLQRKVIRAIGDPTARFEEDKLRMLRAVRFSATFDFPLEEATANAIRTLKNQLPQVSVERIAAEFRRMLAHRSRTTAIQLLIETELFGILFPDADSITQTTRIQSLVAELKCPAFEPSFAVLLQNLYQPNSEEERKRCHHVRKACKAWKLSNTETECICWILLSADQCQRQPSIPLHVMKPILADERHLLLIDFLTASASHTENHTAKSSAQQLAKYREQADPDLMNPTALITGKDLFDLGVKAGPQFSTLISEVRRLQLDEIIATQEEAIAWVKTQLESETPSS